MSGDREERLKKEKKAKERKSVLKRTYSVLAYIGFRARTIVLVYEQGVIAALCVARSKLAEVTIDANLSKCHVSTHAGTQRAHGGRHNRSTIPLNPCLRICAYS